MVFGGGTPNSVQLVDFAQKKAKPVKLCTLCGVKN
jgi:hypothetical protein